MVSLPVTFVLLLTYFLHGGSVLTHGIVAHSEMDCEQAKPLIQQSEFDRKTVTVGNKIYNIDFIDAQCVRVPAITNT